MGIVVTATLVASWSSSAYAGSSSGVAMTFSIASLTAGVVLAARVHQAGVAEEHLEGLRRRLAAGEAVDGQRLLVVDVDQLGELGLRDGLDGGLEADLGSWAWSSSGTPSGLLVEIVNGIGLV